MPLKSGKLTPQERTFSAAYAATGDQGYAGHQAGYKGAPGASMALARPAVQAEIAKIQTARLFNEALPLAVDTIIDIMTSKTSPAGARIQAAKLAIDRTLGTDEAGNAKEPHEMTGEELAEAIQKLNALKAERSAVVIDHETVEAPESGVFD